MARGISTYPNNNYVMIFKNGELYDKYDTIAYDIFNFNVTMIPNTDVTDTDVFEFVYYLNINNETFPVVYNNITVPSKIKNGTYESGTNISIDAIPCNTTLYNPENMMVIIDKIPDGEYNEYIDFNTGLTGYNLNYKIMSYKDLLKKDNDNLFVTSTLTDDTMINGLYRVTKQGGGEYFILPSVKPVETTEDPGNITLCSHRQFRYMKTIVSASSDSYKLNLNNEFKYCTYQSHFMIFHNHKLVPMNSIIAHTIDKTPLDKPVLYLDISVSIGDIIEVFYISNDLRSLNSNVENGTKRLNDNGQPIDQIQNTAYIRFESPLYTVSSKHSLFVFLNGKKIPMFNMEDISDTIIKILNNQESCERLEILNHIGNETINDKVFIKDGLSHENNKIQSIDLSTLQTYENPCKLDELLNHSSDAQLNTLFETTSSVTGTVAIVNGNYQSKDTILQRILADYVISGDPGEWIANVK